MRRTPILLAFVAAFICAAPLTATPPNVLLVMSDDLNCDLGCYGHPVINTPHIDKLEARSLRFDRAYCQFPLCNPSRASLLSGLRPDTTRVLGNSTPPLKTMPDRVYLPMLFRKAGYFTAASGKIFHGQPEFDVPASWDERDDPGKAGEAKTIHDKKDFDFLSAKKDALGRMKIADADTATNKVAANAVRWIEKCAKVGKPFFVAAGFRKPHLPWIAPDKYFDLYPVASVPPLPVPPSGPEKGRKKFTDAERREATVGYYACVSHMDAGVGQLIDTLDRLKLWDNTVVVFMSDHGYHLGDHGRWEKMSLYENSARGPLMIHAPAAAGNGKVCRRVVEYLDLYPTLADLAGLTPPKDLHGASLRPLLAKPDAAWDRPAFTVMTAGDDPELLRSVRTERFRYITSERGETGPLLFDLVADPHELVNLAADPKHADTVAELKGLLKNAGLPAPSRRNDR